MEYKSHGIFALLCLLNLVVSEPLSAQTAPDVPEPGLIIYGQLFAGINGAAPLAITSAAWNIDDGTLNFTVSGTSAPPVRIVQANGQSFYIASIPFRTHRVEATTFAGPSGASQWLELKAQSGNYALTPTINNAATYIKSIGGAAQSAGAVAVTTIGLNAGERGKMIRVDLYTDTQQPASYDQWADQKFGGHTAPNQLADADFDGDGLSNGNEWRAGTDPKDTSSGLRIVSLGRGADGDSITWESVIGKIYFIEVSADLGKLQPWAAVGGSVTAVNEQSSSTVPRSPGQALRFFRVKVKE